MQIGRNLRDAKLKRARLQSADGAVCGGSLFRCAAMAVLVASGCVQMLFAQQVGPGAAENGVTRDVDAELAAQIYSTKAMDNHAHPVLPPPNDTTDRDFDALPVDNMEPATDVVAWRADNPQLPAAWKALWNFDVPPNFKGSLDAEGMKRLEAARSVVKAREGIHYAEWVLDQANIGVMVANRVAMGPGLQKPAFAGFHMQMRCSFRWITLCWERKLRTSNSSSR